MRHGNLRNRVRAVGRVGRAHVHHCGCSMCVTARRRSAKAKRLHGRGMLGWVRRLAEILTGKARKKVKGHRRKQRAAAHRAERMHERSRRRKKRRAKRRAA